jgi:hypothetical protein
MKVFATDLPQLAGHALGFDLNAMPVKRGLPSRVFQTRRLSFAASIPSI